MINKITFIFTFLLFNTIYSQTSFEWETATDNGDNLTETIDGITTTTSYIDVEIIDAGGFNGSTANIAASFTETTLVTFTFSEPVIVNSILALEGTSSNIDYTFTPSGGNNSIVTASLISGSSSVMLNWSDVTSFTVTTSTSAVFGFDNLTINDTSTLSILDFNSENMKTFPNPSSDFIQIPGLTKKTNYIIYNINGLEIRKGNISKYQKVDIKNLANGLYLLKLEDRSAVKFIKE